MVIGELRVECFKNFSECTYLVSNLALLDQGYCMLMQEVLHDPTYFRPWE